MAVSAKYKASVLRFVQGQHPTTRELLKEFPRAPLREMEKVDQTIKYVDDCWQLVNDTAEEESCG